MKSIDEHDRLSLDYFTRRHCSRQWRTFLKVLASEMQSSAGKEESARFMRHVGRHLASEYPLDAPATLGDLEAQINARLDSMDWGWCTLNASDDQLAIEHVAYPVAVDTVEDPVAGEAWTRTISALLEGLYKHWLDGEGGDAPIAYRHGEPGRYLAFRYGGS